MKAIISLAPFVENQIPIGGKPTVYVCENHLCKLPVKEIDQLERLLDKLQ